MTNIVNRILETNEYLGFVSSDEEARLRKIIGNGIKKIQKLNNKFLYASFVIKKQEKKDYKVIELLHCTPEENVSSIEKENLDWRLVRRSRYGDGVSFSEDSGYAARYSSRTYGGKAFIVCDVLVDRKKTVWPSYGSFPEDDEDTHQSYDGNVYVKFDDFTFYPKYAVYF